MFSNCGSSRCLSATFFAVRAHYCLDCGHPFRVSRWIIRKGFDERSTWSQKHAYLDLPDLLSFLWKAHWHIFSRITTLTKQFLSSYPIRCHKTRKGIYQIFQSFFFYSIEQSVWFAEVCWLQCEIKQETLGSLSFPSLKHCLKLSIKCIKKLLERLKSCKITV